MLKKLKIDLLGYQNRINTGVNRTKIFHKPSDKNILNMEPIN